MKYAALLLVFSMLQTYAQLSVGLGVGNSNFRKIVPYSGSVHNFPVMTFAEANMAYRFKKQPISVGLTAGLWASQRIEESFNPPNWSRANISYFTQQMYLGSFQYSWLQKNRIEMYSGVAIGGFTFLPNFGVVYNNGNSIQYINWDKNGKRNFRAAFGAQSGIIIGNKKLRTKIELRHVFFTQYEFAKLAQEMNTSLTIGLVWVFAKK
jgi:hypothetical protein